MKLYDKTSGKGRLGLYYMIRKGESSVCFKRFIFCKEHPIL